MTNYKNTIKRGCLSSTLSTYTLWTLDILFTTKKQDRRAINSLVLFSTYIFYFFETVNYQLSIVYFQLFFATPYWLIFCFIHQFRFYVPQK